MATGRAAVFFGPGKPFEIREVPLPEVEPGAVLIKVSLADPGAAVGCQADHGIEQAAATFNEFGEKVTR